MPGRKPKPTQLKLVQGNPGKRPLNMNEPVITEPLGAAPKGWSDEARAVWRELAAQIPEGVATRADRVAFELLVHLVIRMRSDPAGITPAFAAQLRNACAVFGLTPADRSRISVEPPNYDDPAEQYFT